MFLYPDQRKYIQKKECEGAGVFSLATGFDLVLSEYIETETDRPDGSGDLGKRRIAGT